MEKQGIVGAKQGNTVEKQGIGVKKQGITVEKRGTGVEKQGTASEERGIEGEKQGMKSKTPGTSDTKQNRTNTEKKHSPSKTRCHKEYPARQLYKTHPNPNHNSKFKLFIHQPAQLCIC